MAVTATLTASILVNDTRNVGLNTANVLTTNKSVSASFTDGAAALMANQWHASLQTLTAGALNVDLSGVLADLFGSTLIMARVKGLYFKNLGTGNLTIGAHATNPFINFLNAAGTITLPPSGFLLAVAPDATGWAVTAGTGDLIKIAGTGSETFELGVLAAST